MRMEIFCFGFLVGFLPILTVTENGFIICLVYNKDISEPKPTRLLFLWQRRTFSSAYTQFPRCFLIEVIGRGYP